MTEPISPARRPIASRSSRSMQAIAAWLSRTAITPNQISGLSVLFAILGAALILIWPHPLCFIALALCVQLRLLCNLLDGMVAIEGGKKSDVGALYNEFPDRIADTLFLVAPGYVVGRPELGWAAALFAALTAYIRVFGGSVGLPQDFGGVMAKQRRMALLTAGLVLQAIEHAWFGAGWTMLGATLILIAGGSLVTCITRTLAIARALKTSSSVSRETH